MLKVVENLGVSHVRSSDLYKTKLEAEFRRLKFPYRVSINEKEELFFFFFFALFSVHHSEILNKDTGDEILFLKLKFWYSVRVLVCLQGYGYFSFVHPLL